MLAWREHTCNTPKRGSQQTQLRTVEGLAFGPGVLTPNPQQASKQARQREIVEHVGRAALTQTACAGHPNQRANLGHADTGLSVCLFFAKQGHTSGLPRNTEPGKGQGASHVNKCRASTVRSECPCSFERGLQIETQGKLCNFLFPSKFVVKEYYSFGESTWDLFMFIGTGASQPQQDLL